MEDKFKLGQRVIASDKPISFIIKGTVIGFIRHFDLYLVKADNVGDHEKHMFHDGRAISNKLDWGVYDETRRSRFFAGDGIIALKSQPLTEVAAKTKEKEVQVRRFPSGAIRSDDRGREKPSFVSPYALTEIAKHFSKNASFFNGNDSGKNYMKGIKPADIQDSLLRHANELQVALLPGKKDRDAVKEALVSIAANCIMGLHQIVMEEKGEYDEPFDSMEYITKG